MATHMLGSLVEVHSTPTSLPIPSAPAKAIPRTYPGAPQSSESDAIELPPWRPRSSRDHSPPRAGSGSGATTPPVDLEMSRPTSPRPGEVVEAMQSLSNPSRNRYRFASGCVTMFLNGLTDSAPGALIPYLEEYYDIGYAVVSLIFVSVAVGFILAAGVLDPLRRRLGRGRLLAVSQTLMVLGYIPLVVAAPFPAVAASFALIGFAMSINIAMANTFCGTLQNGTAWLGVMHGCYGVGGTVGPLIATAIVTAAGAPWNRYYLLTLGIALFTVASSTWAFWDYDENEPLPRAQQPLRSAAEREESESVAATHALGLMGLKARRLVFLGSLFIFAYQGAEVSISGWVISFLITARNGDPSSVGYVTAGFWAGITIGRFLLSAPAHRIGERRFVFAVTVGSAIFEGLVWGVPHVVGDAVAVAIVGLLLGPVYPCAAAVMMRGMNRSERFLGMSVVSAFGSSGGAIAPFTTGILAQLVGPWALHPVAIFLFFLMMVCWYFTPDTKKRSE